MLMQITNSLASAGGTLHKVYNYWKLLSPSKRRRLNASFQSQNVDRLNFFSPFLSYLYNVKKLDSTPKCVDDTSRISGCFSRNCFQENYPFLEILCMQSPWQHHHKIYTLGRKAKVCSNNTTICNWWLQCGAGQLENWLRRIILSLLRSFVS